MTEKEFNKIKERLAKASKRPLYFQEGHICFYSMLSKNFENVEWKDYEFFCDAPQDISALITYVLELRQAVSELAGDILVKRVTQEQK